MVFNRRAGRQGEDRPKDQFVPSRKPDDNSLGKYSPRQRALRPERGSGGAAGDGLCRRVSSNVRLRDGWRRRVIAPTWPFAPDPLRVTGLPSADGPCRGGHAYGGGDQCTLNLLTRARLPVPEPQTTVRL